MIGDWSRAWEKEAMFDHIWVVSLMMTSQETEVKNTGSGSENVKLFIWEGKSA